MVSLETPNFLFTVTIENVPKTNYLLARSVVRLPLGGQLVTVLPSLIHQRHQPRRKQLCNKI